MTNTLRTADSRAFLGTRNIALLFPSSSCQPSPNKSHLLACFRRIFLSCSVAGHVPTLPWVRSARVWVRVGLESGLASGKGWVGTWPVTRLGPISSCRTSGSLGRVTVCSIWSCGVATGQVTAHCSSGVRYVTIASIHWNGIHSEATLSMRNYLHSYIQHK